MRAGEIAPGRVEFARGIKAGRRGHQRPFTRQRVLVLVLRIGADGDDGGAQFRFERLAERTGDDGHRLGVGRAIRLLDLDLNLAESRGRAVIHHQRQAVGAGKVRNQRRPGRIAALDHGLRTPGPAGRREEPAILQGAALHMCAGRAVELHTLAAHRVVDIRPSLGHRSRVHLIGVDPDRHRLAALAAMRDHQRGAVQAHHISQKARLGQMRVVQRGLAAVRLFHQRPVEAQVSSATSRGRLAGRAVQLHRGVDQLRQLGQRHGHRVGIADFQLDADLVARGHGIAHTEADAVVAGQIGREAGGRSGRCRQRRRAASGALRDLPLIGQCAAIGWRARRAVESDTIAGARSGSGGSDAGRGTVEVARAATIITSASSAATGGQEHGKAKTPKDMARQEFHG
ncbi:hypothetical protein APV28_1160 [Comamonas testosteroni]|nr:hypothetical protein APV28_1160 [Comamonas testosteroni]